MTKLMQLENKCNKENYTPKVISDLHFEKLESDLEKALNLRETLKQPFLRKEELALVKFSMESYLGDTLTFRSESYSDELSQLKLRNENFIVDAFKKLLQWLSSFFGGGSGGADEAAKPTPETQRKEPKEIKEIKEIKPGDTVKISFLFKRSKNIFPARNLLEVEKYLKYGLEQIKFLEDFYLTLEDCVLTMGGKFEVNENDYKNKICSHLKVQFKKFGFGAFRPNCDIPENWDPNNDLILGLNYPQSWNTQQKNHVINLNDADYFSKDFYDKKFDKDFNPELKIYYPEGINTVKKLISLMQENIEGLNKLYKIRDKFSVITDNIYKQTSQYKDGEDLPPKLLPAQFTYMFLNTVVGFFNKIIGIIKNLKLDKEDNEDLWADYLKS